MSETLKECHKCKRFLPKSEFHKDRTMSDGLCSKCKECVKESNKQYRNAHKKYWRDYNKQYYERTKEELANKLGKKCKICGRTPRENRKLFIAHEIHGKPHSQSRNYIMEHLDDFLFVCVYHVIGVFTSA